MSSSRSRHSSAPPTSHSNAVTLHFKERSHQTRPLYRPAALRRPGTSSVERVSSPPPSPSLSEAGKGTWLSTLAPWSPALNDTPKELVGGGQVRGRMLSRSQWKTDAEVENCADPDCSQRFDLLNRRHHCRTCGDIFCGSHSSRSTLLWQSSDAEPVTAFTPRGTPRGTPRSSSVDLTALNTSGYSISPTSSHISTSSSASTSTSTPTSSPPNPTSMPVVARVCDRCYFSAPPATTPFGVPLLTSPVVLPAHVPWAFGGAAASARPLTLRHPRGLSSSRSRSRATSPSGIHGSGSSPPSSRSRQGSAASASSSLSAGGSAASSYSTPSTSVEALAQTMAGAKLTASAAARQRALSPATSLRAHSSGGSLEPSAVVEEDEPYEDSAPALEGVGKSFLLPQRYTSTGAYVEDDASASDSDSDDDELHAATVRERRREMEQYGSVRQGVNWSTF